MLTLNGVKYGNIFCAPGAQGFFGEGYPYHRYFRHLGLNWGDAAVGSPMHCGFVSKTITLNERAGNMPMRSDRLTPRELIPRSIVVKPFSGHVLNAVGLTGPGIDWALESGRWQSRTAPFMISFMPVAGSPDERLAETKQFVERLKAALARFSTPVALQFNRACPNTGHPPSEFYSETEAHLDILAELGIPIVINYNPTVPVKVMQTTTKHEACTGLWIANTIPWDDPRINWQHIFGTTKSPLEARGLPIGGAGGLSGPACFPHTVERVLEARAHGITKPIVAGNGIQHPSDVRVLFNAGADAVAIGTIAMVRPWRMTRIIRAANTWDDCDWTSA